MATTLKSELQEIKLLLSKILGTSDLKPEEQFSEEVLNDAGKLFLKFRTERGEWIEEGKLSKIFKGCHWHTGKFLREHFRFTDYYKQGHTYYFNRKSIQRLADELKSRNVDLDRYMEYVNSEAAFRKSMADTKARKRGKRPYLLPDDPRDIKTSDPPKPDVQIVRDDLKKLKNEFFHFKMEVYVDIYKGNYAMMKFVYEFDRYLEPSMKSMCRKWCDNFNYANHALELLTKKKENFVPVKEDDMIEL